MFSYSRLRNKVMLFLLVVLSCIVAQAIAGERPKEAIRYYLGRVEQVSLENVPEGSYHSGTVRVKLINDHILDDALVQSEDYVVTGNEDLDRLNKRYSITEYRPLLHGLYSESPEVELDRDLHRAWEFHRWFDLSFPSDIDVIETARSFLELPEVDMAEPVYIKKTVEPFERTVVGDIDSYPTRWEPNDPNFGEQWGLHNTGQTIRGSEGREGSDIGAVEAWDLEKGYNDVIVAVMDNGIDYEHEDLVGNLWPDIGPQGIFTPRNSHGTSVAGVIGAVSNNDLGIAGIAGGSGSDDGVRIMACNVINTNATYSSRVLYAVRHGAAIMNNSWIYNTPCVYNASDLNAIDYFNNNAGSFIMDGGLTFFAAGNANSSDRYYPSYYQGTIAVAALDNRDVRSSFTNYGDWIDMSGPGTNIMTTGRSAGIAGGYEILSSSSLAVSMVSGAAALVASYTYRNGLVFTNDLIEDLLVEHSDNVNDINPNFAGRLGSGRVNISRVLNRINNFYIDQRNPQAFNALTQSTTEILLTWQANETGDDIMIVSHYEPDIGSPIDGEDYEAGDEIPGGGVVIYCEDSGLNQYLYRNLRGGRKYYFRAYSFTDNYNYSLGVNANAATEPPDFDMPFTENFDKEDIMPPLWEVVDLLNNEQVWQVGRFSGGMQGTNRNYVFVNSAAYQPNHTQITQLISPSINMEDIESVSIKFHHKFTRANTVTAAQIHYKIGDSPIWHQIERWNESTANRATFEKIIPDIAGESQVRFRWSYHGMGDSHWCVDDVEIFETVHFPPTDISTTIVDSTIVLSWTPPESEDSLSFNVFRDGNLMTIEPISDTLFVDHDVQLETHYSYYLTTVYPDGESVRSEQVRAIILPEPPDLYPPVNVAYSLIDFDVHLSWERSPDMHPDIEVDYLVFRNDELISTEIVTDTSYVDENIDPENIYVYYLKTQYQDEKSAASDTVIVRVLSVDEQSQPIVTALIGNYPNPFNPATAVVFDISEPADVLISIYDIRGRLVATLIDEYLDKGRHNAVWSGRDDANRIVSSGVYFVRMEAGLVREVRKILLMK